MDDQAILKRLAEIEGWVWRVTQVDPVPATGWRDESADQPTPNLMDPLANDAQAMGLVKKYNMDIVGRNDEFGTLWSAWIYFSEDDDFEGDHDESLNRAICLAVIAAHEIK